MPREEHRQKVFENRTLRRVLWSKRGEVTGEWRRLHNEELYDLYCSPNTNKGELDGRSMWHVWGKRRGIYRVWWGNMK